MIILPILTGTIPHLFFVLKSWQNCLLGIERKLHPNLTSGIHWRRDGTCSAGNPPGYCLSIASCTDHGLYHGYESASHKLGSPDIARKVKTQVSIWAHINPFTPESDQCQIFPPAPLEILHHTVWRTWLFIAYSDEKWLYYKFSLHHSYYRFLKGWENTLFELRSERVNPFIPKSSTINLKLF